MDLKITRPTLLLDEDKLKSNLEKMLNKAENTQTELIPHFKTHQSEQIGELFRAAGIDRIAVSSVKMAEHFAKLGWKDITIAFPFNVLEVEAINAMLAQGIQITILISDPDTFSKIENKFKAKVHVMIELDTGYGRSGISSEAGQPIRDLAEKIVADKALVFYGLYAHPGHTYHANSIEEIKQIWATSIKQMNVLRNMLNPLQSDIKIRIGDTPGCSIVENMDGVDEIGPGNFIFYDLVMNYLGVCSEDEIAVAVACPVVAKYAERNELVIHGGAVHFSKDHLFDEHEQKFFGEMVILKEDGWSSIIPNAKLKSLSQEHGIVKTDAHLFDKIQLGDVLGFLPIHSCLTANLMRDYFSIQGNHFDHMEKL